jgi:hypothetical protein
MPKLGAKKTQTVYLPSTKDEVVPEDRAWVKINTSVKVEQVVGIEDYESQLEQTAFALSKLIEEWNFTNEENDELAPINIDTVKKMPLPDFNYLGLWLKGQVEKQTAGVPVPLKEASSST